MLFIVLSLYISLNFAVNILSTVYCSSASSHTRFLGKLCINSSNRLCLHFTYRLQQGGTEFAIPTLPPPPPLSINRYKLNNSAINFAIKVSISADQKFFFFKLLRIEIHTGIYFRSHLKQFYSISPKSYCNTNDFMFFETCRNMTQCCEFFSIVLKYMNNPFTSQHFCIFQHLCCAHCKHNFNPLKGTAEHAIMFYATTRQLTKASVTRKIRKMFAPRSQNGVLLQNLGVR